MPIVGVLGGMGPLSTAAFYESLVRATPAAGDADHLRVLIWSDPAIPPRVEPLLDPHAPSPLPAMLAGLERLERAGAEILAIPCNTAHHWFDELARGREDRLVHIGEAVADELAAALSGMGSDRPARIGLLATAGTVRSGFYQRLLAARGLEVEPPGEALMREAVLPAIAGVKRGELDRPRRLLAEALGALVGRGVDGVAIACTELTLVTPDPEELPTVAVDSCAALARAVVCRALGRRPNLWR